MPNPISAVACADSYTDAATIGPLTMGSNGGYFTIATNDVFMQLGYKEQGRGVSEIRWMDEAHVPVGNGVFFKGTYAARFRNFAAGSVATVSGGLATPTQPLFTIAAGGVATPSTSNVITGAISSSGAITAGSGFTINASHSAGLYVITFNTAFSAAPSPQLTVEPASTDPGNGRGITIGVQAGTLTTTGFTAQVQSSVNGALIDRAWTFVAYPVS